MAYETDPADPRGMKRPPIQLTQDEAPAQAASPAAPPEPPEDGNYDASKAPRLASRQGGFDPSYKRARPMMGIHTRKYASGLANNVQSMDAVDTDPTPPHGIDRPTGN